MPALPNFSTDFPSNRSSQAKRGRGAVPPARHYLCGLWEGGSTERLIPFDFIPRILDRAEWDLVERGCNQRVKAINVFLYDIYHEREFVKAGLVPEELVLRNPAFRSEMLGTVL
jgi:uncharacterized circularly permuted ATP-grasp superfamily protein